ncbi:PQQ-binding-like beta-propeller repeat protein [Xylanimonas sp. McL0601]|uniref:outer membrane protein assembly factor BamB family protein n=1 Tax=Xylanimonas sp. McL0601 TaxID=3414739 RepID=UPI003CF901A7
MKHRDVRATVTFDLEPEDEAPSGVPDDAHARGTDPRPSVAGRVARTVRAWSPRRRFVVAGTLVGLAVAGFGAVRVVDAVHDQTLRARVATAPGGVVSLAHAPARLWRTEIDHPEPLALMDGLLVVSERASTTGSGIGDGLTLKALDPDDGHVRWSTTVGGARSCGTAPGPTGWGRDVGTAAELVCLTGPAGGRVVVVGEGGRVTAERALRGRTAGEVALAVPGAVLRVSRVGSPVPAPPFVDGALSAAFATRDLRVRLEDAQTGAERWAATVPGSSAPAGTAIDTMYLCSHWSADAAEVETVDDQSGLSSDIGARRVSLRACGIAATVDLATGAIVQRVDPFDPSAGWDPGAVPLDGAGYATRLPSDGSGVEVDRIWREDGSLVSDVVGPVALPSSTDGSPADVLLTNGLQGLAAFDPADATKLWVHASQGAVPIARSARVLVVAVGGDVVALAPRTGRELWNRPVLAPEPDSSGHPEQLVRAFTDGHRVVLVGLLNGGFLDGDGNGDVWLHALDLSTGELLWRVERRGPLPQSIGGRLYEVGADAVVALG